jgi:hypothetical protein
LLFGDETDTRRLHRDIRRDRINAERWQAVGRLLRRGVRYEDAFDEAAENLTRDSDHKRVGAHAIRTSYFHVQRQGTAARYSLPQISHGSHGSTYSATNYTDDLDS